MTDIITAADLSVRYGKKEVLRNLNLTLAPGEILGIIGPNGSGKTTALSCIEGLSRPYGGQVRVFGRDPVRERKYVYSRMGVQLQESSYPLRIRTDELCRLFASFYKEPADWHILLESFGLLPLLKRRVRNLSGGEKQRLSLVLALMGRPEILILDEITAGLDPEGRRRIRGALRQQARNGAAMIIVTHYPDELEDFAHRILLLEEGSERFCGTVSAFRHWAAAAAGKSENAPLEVLYLALTEKTDGGAGRKDI